MAIVVGIDPGHGWPDIYNRGPSGYVEAVGVMDLAFACRKELERNGIDVVQTRVGARGLTIARRAKILNAARAACNVSIHTNGAADPRVRGVECIHSIVPRSKGRFLAQEIYRKLVNNLNLPGRRIFSRKSMIHPGKDYYGIIRLTKAPTIIVEVEFHSNLEAEKLLLDLDFRYRAGMHIARGIQTYLGLL